jgi:hypothetical protein
VVDVARMTCDPEKAVASLGDVVLGYSCGSGFVFQRGEFKGAYPASPKQRILARSGALWVFVPKAWYDSASARPGAAWSVTRVGSSGQIETVEFPAEEQSCERVKTSHDIAYRVLAVEGVTLDSEQRLVRRRLEWRWDEVKGAFMPSIR